MLGDDTDISRYVVKLRFIMLVERYFTAVTKGYTARKNAFVETKSSF